MWVDVKEVKPPHGLKVLVRLVTPESVVYYEDRFSDYFNCWSEAIDPYVTHWAKLPHIEECPTCGSKMDKVL